jgi:hypothetical protein
MAIGGGETLSSILYLLSSQQSPGESWRRRRLRDLPFLSRVDSDTSSPTAELVVRMNTGNFFAELKRRNVYKIAVAYAVVSWLLIQIATQAFPFFEVPTGRSVLWYWCSFSDFRLRSSR